MKRYILSLLALVLFAGTSVFAQGSDDDAVLFSFDNTQVSKSEFLRVYNKYNVGDEADYSETSLSEYLELYINFRLKVREAEAIGLDTVKAINDELGTYRKQLANSYLFDKQVNDKLVEEAYNRMKEAVHASHILIQIQEPGLPEDTLDAYNKIMSIRKQFLGGKDFGDLAAEYSDDPSAVDNKGDIGYFTVFQTVYPFESAAYKTPVGEVSMPVRTKFGYHLVLVHERKANPGKIQAAHILLRFPENYTDEDVAAKKKIAEDVWSKLEAGTSFKDLAAQFSEDQYTASNGGTLPEFGVGRMVPEFENAAFDLENDGDYTKPVMTDFGWHIILRQSAEPLGTYEESKNQLKSKVEKDSRSGLAKSHLIDRIKSDYGYVENQKNYTEMLNTMDESLQNGEWAAPEEFKGDKELFKIGEESYIQKDLAEYIQNNQTKPRSNPISQIFRNFFNLFVEQKVIAYEEARLEEKYPDFKALMGEYRDGILLYEIKDMNVWSKAIKDTSGLKSFYQEHKDQYMWKERVDANIYYCKDQDAADMVRKYAKKKKYTVQDVLGKINTTENPDNVMVESGKFEKGQNELIDGISWDKGFSDDITREDGTIIVVKINEVLPVMHKQLNETKGAVISDYQEHLEEKWNTELRAKYPVKINDEVFKSMIQ